MGWTVTYEQRLKPFLQERTQGWSQFAMDGGSKRLEKKVVCLTYHYCMHNPGSGVLYKVMETQRMAPDGVTVVERDRWIGVDLVKYYGGRNRSEGWGYKDMEASMGPTSHGCPLSYVDEWVPEPPPCPKGRCDKDGYAKEPDGRSHNETCPRCHGCGRCWEKEWRERVRAYHKKAKRQREFLKNLKPGDVIVIAQGWTNAGSLETVQEVFPKRRKLRAGGWTIPSRAIDIDASLEAVGIDKEVA